MQLSLLALVRSANRQQMLLQRPVLDRFLQNWIASEAVVDCLSSISGYEDKGQALGNQALGLWLDQLAAETNVEYGSVDILVGDKGKGFGDVVADTSHLEAELDQHVRYGHCDQRLILHQKQAIAGERLRDRDRLLAQ